MRAFYFGKSLDEIAKRFQNSSHKFPVITVGVTELLMKRLFACLLAAGTISQSEATLLFYDSFNYSSGSLGTAGSPTWVRQGTSPDPMVQNVGGLTYPGLQVSSDTLSLQYDGSGINYSNGAPAATDAHTISAGITTGSIYYSLLLKVTAVQTFYGTTNGNGFATGVNLTQGSFMAGPQTVAAGTAPAVGTTAAPLLILTGDGTQFSSTYRLGTSKTATAVDRQFATQTFSTGAGAETVFVVLKYTFDSVNGDSASLFINPTPGGAEPAAQLTVSAGTALTLNSGIQSFFVRNNSVEPDTLLIDELRIGDTWADVTPVPEPSTALLGVCGLMALLAWRGRKSILL
jgi:hypothetical protein